MDLCLQPMGQDSSTPYACCDSKRPGWCGSGRDDRVDDWQNAKLLFEEYEDGITHARRKQTDKVTPSPRLAAHSPRRGLVAEAPGRLVAVANRKHTPSALSHAAEPVEGDELHHGATTRTGHVEKICYESEGWEVLPANSRTGTSARRVALRPTTADVNRQCPPESSEAAHVKGSALEMYAPFSGQPRLPARFNVPFAANAAACF